MGDAVAEEIATEIVAVFVCRCPLGETCSKQQGILGKKFSDQEARQVIINHLTASPYHELSATEAEGLADSAIIESWEESIEQVDAAKAEEGQNWFNNRKRARPGLMSETALAAAREMVRRADGSGEPPPSRGNARGSSSTQLAIGAGARGQNAKNITLPRAHLQACVDSLKRARMAAESAAQLCGRASRAFYEEAACITSCQDVLESYVAD
jgi:hypothetical protein